MSHFLQRIEREMKHRHRTPAQVWTRRIVWAILILFTPALIAEITLRAIGFWRPQVDPTMQAKTIRACVEALNQRFATDAFVEDPLLLWRLKSGSNLGGLDIDQEGILGAVRHNPLDVNTAHSAQRVLCLGDSVTAMTYRVYPGTAQRLATSVNLARPLEFRNASVPGYSTEQGLRWFNRLQSWRPDVVLICFGWNDQFRALNIPDRELGYANFLTSFLHRAFGRLRLYQLVAAPVEARLLAKADNTPMDTGTSASLEQPRVSLPQFEENLRALVERARSAGALPVLLTEPENLGEASERNLERRNFISQETGTAIDVHKRYNAVTRRVAVDTHTPLVDLEEEFLRRKRENFFEPDGIHMTGRGHNHVARLILALLREEGRITTAEYDAIARAERHDTTAPDKPRAAWSVVPPHLDAFTTETLNVGVVAHNVGNTRWLRDHVLPQFGTRTDVPYGSVSVIGRWRTINSPNRIAASAPLPSDILPGETTSVTLTMAAPPTRGDYELEIGLRAAEIGELKNFGAETTTFTVTTRP